MTPEHINALFSYHPPKGDQAQRYERINEKARELAHLINDLCPQSSEATTAIRRVQEARMYANASIAINE